VLFLLRLFLRLLKHTAFVARRLTDFTFRTLIQRGKRK